MQAGEPIVLGRLSGLYGVRGAFKVFSYTEPRAAICDYSRWLLRGADGWHEVRLIEGREHGRTVVARLEGIDDRDAAAALLGTDVAVPREALAPAEPGCFYWADLVGLAVVTTDGITLGRVERLFATGANDVMVVAGGRERWLPFVMDSVVRKVDFERCVIEVDWDQDW
ncbi:MAG TPA: ribosome maturation factor RimM [Gammaproteobacteria bacterium]|nr:ribosome maturation factor RimM [Gammaproteobacteria bacterium]